LKKKLAIAKFGGSLLDVKGESIPQILQRISELKIENDLGPIVVFSAPNGTTDRLIQIGDSYAQSSPVLLDPVFEVYYNLIRLRVIERYQKEALKKINNLKSLTLDALKSINKRFSGTIKARILTFGGELAMSTIMDYVLKSNGFNSIQIPLVDWPIVTDDGFEDASPNYELSKKKRNILVNHLENGKIISMAGFLGITSDGLETVLGRGGSDLTAVFLSCLLRKRFHTQTLLFKDIPIQSADPKVVPEQPTDHITALTYNEAHKASMMGMKILQHPAIAMARRFSQPLLIVPIDNPKKYSIIQSRSISDDIVKCITGKVGAAILTMNDEKSRSFEDSLRIWEKRNDFLDLGAETLETGVRIRDFLFLDSDFLRKNEDKLKGFDENLKIEYGLGVVTLIGDRMKNSPGVASLAIGAISGINIKRGIFAAPHTSQIIIVVDEKNVNATVAAIHTKISELNTTG
jgi:aspartate kinase